MEWSGQGHRCRVPVCLCGVLRCATRAVEHSPPAFSRTAKRRHNNAYNACRYMIENTNTLDTRTFVGSSLVSKRMQLLWASLFKASREGKGKDKGKGTGTGNDGDTGGSGSGGGGGGGAAAIQSDSAAAAAVDGSQEGNTANASAQFVVQRARSTLHGLTHMSSLTAYVAVRGAEPNGFVRAVLRFAAVVLCCGVAWCDVVSPLAWRATTPPHQDGRRRPHRTQHTVMRCPPPLRLLLHCVSAWPRNATVGRQRPRHHRRRCTPGASSKTPRPPITSNRMPWLAFWKGTMLMRPCTW